MRIQASWDACVARRISSEIRPRKKSAKVKSPDRYGLENEEKKTATAATIRTSRYVRRIAFAITMFSSASDVGSVTRRSRRRPSRIET
jgi:hypothetical protein